MYTLINNADGTPFPYLNRNKFCAPITFSIAFVQYYTSYKHHHLYALFSFGINKFVEQMDWFIKNGQIWQFDLLHLGVVLVCTSLCG
jgi:hypothetical protein